MPTQNKIVNTNSIWWNMLSSDWKKLFYAHLKLGEKVEDLGLGYDEETVLEKYEKHFGPDDYDKVSEDEIDQILMLPFLNCFCMRFEDFSPINRLHQLKKLVLATSFIQDLDSIGHVLPQLSILNINYTNIRDLAQLGIAVSLKELHYAAVYDSQNEDTPISLASLREMISLEILLLSGYAFQHYGALAELPKLSSLYLTDGHLKSLAHFSKLKLENLQIRRGQISDWGPLLAHKNSLTNLGLFDCRMDNDSVPILKELDLRVLYLEKTKISDFSFLSAYKNLTSLSLFDEKIQDLSVLDGLQELRFFSVGMMGINDAEMKRFKAMHPNCRVLNYG